MRSQFLIALAVTGLPVLAQTTGTGGSCPVPSHLPWEVRESLSLWKGAHGCNWQLIFNELTGKGRMLLGGGATTNPPVVPQTVGGGFALARYWIAQANGILGVNGSSLVNDRVILLPLTQIGTTDKVSVRLRQEIGGVPVQDAAVNLLFDRSTGTLLSIDSTALPGMAGFSVSPGNSGAAAKDLAQASFEAEFGAEPVRVEAPRLVILKERVGGRDEPLLSWQVDVQGLDGAGEEFALGYCIAARGSARVVARLEHVSHALLPQGTRGRVLANATVDGDGVNPWPWIDGAAANSTLVPLANLTVTNSDGLTFTTDANGEFEIPAGQSTQIDLKLAGPYLARVGSELDPLVDMVTDLNNPVTEVVLNPVPTVIDVAQVNAFYRFNQLRDWVRTVNPYDETADQRAPGFAYRISVNATKPCQVFGGGNPTATCNAEYSAFSDRILVSAASASLPPCGAGCPNASFAPLLWHELGHWLIQRYGNAVANPATQPAGVAAFHEGVADALALYLMDFPVLQYGNRVRSGENDPNVHGFCGDCEGQQACHGQDPHFGGLPIMGALWKVRRHLQTDFPATGGVVADTLFLAWLNAYDQNRIHSILEYQWLVLDDDDHDLGNHTPHLPSIDAGLVEQGFPGFHWPIVTAPVICN